MYMARAIPTPRPKLMRQKSKNEAESFEPIYCDQEPKMDQLVLQAIHSKYGVSHSHLVIQIEAT